MTLPRTNIEYGTKSWNWLTGCANGPDICKTSDKCWAKGIAGRFHRDFTPTFHEDIFHASFPRKPGARILVCFTGDISFADYDDRVEAAIRIRESPQHTFILLTKRPKEAFADIIWTSNAWLGASLTGAETPDRQRQVMAELKAVKGQHKTWLSYEPMLGPLQVNLSEIGTLRGSNWEIDWLVMGAQSGKGKEEPELSWAVNAALFLPNGVPIWYKNNCPSDWFGYKRRQELPK